MTLFNNICVVAPHADDETLGCGGVMQMAGKTTWILITESEPDILSNIEKIKKIYNCEFYHLHYPQCRLSTELLPEIITSLHNVFMDIQPETVFLPFLGDIHTDHWYVFRAGVSVLRPDRMANYGVKQVLCYETVSESEAGLEAFNPNVFINIGNEVYRKSTVFERYYKSQKQQMPRIRTASGIQALARLRGATIGVEFAEAFMLIREVV